MPTAQQVYSMLGNESLWEVAGHCHDVLAAEEIPYSVCGGVAVCLHGYQRNTVDLDLVIRREDSEVVQAALTKINFQWDSENKQFSSAHGIVVQLLVAGDSAGSDEVRIPAPVGESNVEIIEGLSVVRLSRLIEMKLASGSGNMRRTYKDFADVVELIAVRKLDSSFARFLHKSLRETYRKLVRNAQTDS